MKTSLASALGGLVLLATVPVQAMDPAPLPAFEVRSLDGQPVASSGLGPAGKWLLVYVTPRSHPSELLLRLVKKQEDGDAATRMVVVVGGSLAEAQTVCDAFPALARATWYADPDRAAFTALAIKGAPTAIGLRDRSLQWKLDGVPADTGTVKSILLSWVAK
jgi:hypothetical protein